ncbi:MAG: VCBS repeat-containing protein, partial [Nanoarchaeota archaeon]|nr:VCBS repeat-containing protein [Nanoarchaeota archaeon]
MSSSSVTGGAAGGAAATAGEPGTAIFVDVDDNNAWIVEGMEFNSTDYYSEGTFKTLTTDNFIFTNITSLSSPLIRFKSSNTFIFQAENINFTSETITPECPRLDLRYNQTFVDTNKIYNNGMNLSLEKTGVSRIDFIPALNNVGDISANTNLSFNRIFLNSTGESDLNVSANITLHGLTFSGVDIAYDPDDDGIFTICPSDVCTELSYNGSTAIFNVTHFTTYKATSNVTNLPVINLVSPADNYSSTGPNITFFYNVSDADDGLVNCSLILNNVINQTDSSITEDVNQSFNLWLINNTYNWSINCTDDSPTNNVGSSVTRNLSVTAQINISETLTPSTANINSNVVVSGKVNFSDGTNVANTGIHIYLNETLLVNVSSNLVQSETSWWDDTFNYRCNISITEPQSMNRTNWLIVINGSDLNQSCSNILQAKENSIRMTDNNSVEINSKLHDWNSSKTGFDTDDTVDADDDLTFVINLTEDTSQEYWVYYDLSYNTSKDYSNSILDLYSAEIFVAVGGSGGWILYSTANRDGTFSAFSSVEDVGANAWGIGLADFDNDGDYDIVTGDDAGNIYFLEKTGAGNSFAGKVNIGTYTDTDYTMDIAPADFDNDGNMDFVFSGNGDEVFIAEGFGNGSFTISTLDSNGPGTNGRAKDAGDFNEDGCMDFLMAA